MENNGLRVNKGKTKLIVSGPNLDVLKKYPCGVCQTNVGRNAIYFSGCRQWLHKKCSGIKGSLASNLDFKCARCFDTARSVDGRLVKKVMVVNETLEVASNFCYYGNILFAGSGCELASLERCKFAWGKFRQLIPFPTNCHLSLSINGRIYSTCTRCAMFHATETWVVKVSVLNRLERNDLTMIHWMCNVRANDNVHFDSLLSKLGIQNVDVVLCTSSMRWFGQVERRSP